MIVSRPKLSWFERMYLPGVLVGLKITAGHFLRFVFGKGKVTMQYPEEKWTLPAGYRGAPRSSATRKAAKSASVASLRICLPAARHPHQARRNPPRLAPRQGRESPKAFDIDMIRCIYCGLCEEVCPEEAIFLLKDYAITGLSRAEMVHDKAKLYELGGTLPKPIHKWDANK